MCLEAAESDETAFIAAMLAKCLVLGKANRQLAERAEPTFAQAMKKHGYNAEFLFNLATWRLVQEQDKEAIPLLRQVLTVEPRNIMAMNNLAVALAEQAASREEAKQLIDRAIARAGPVAELLDTKGTLLLSAGDAAGAVKLLEEATSRSVPDPRHLFHLALAYQRAGKAAEARDAFDRARQKGLDAAVLPPKQKRQLNELERELRS